MIFMKRVFFILLILNLIRMPNIFASNNPGTTGLNFLKIEVGAKSSAMGGAFSAVCDDASAVYWNPAGLANLDYKQLSIMHLSWFEGINYQFLSYVHPVNNLGTLGASIYYLSVGDIPSYDNNGARLNGDIGVSDMAFALSYGRSSTKLDYGLTIKFIQEKLDDVSASAYALDAGILYKLNTTFLRSWMKDKIGQEFKIALGLQNMGPDVKFIQKEDPLPLNYRLGISQDFFYNSLTIACDVNLPKDNDYYINSGIEYKITDWVALRGGYKFQSNNPEHSVQPDLVGGIGLGNEFVTVDYAFVPYGVLGETHRIGLNMRFGRAYNEDLVEVKIKKQLKTAKKYYYKKDLVNAYHYFSNILLIDPVNEQAKEYMVKINSEIDETKVDKYLMQVKTYLEQDKLIEAKQLIDKVLVLFPDSPKVKEFQERIEVVFQQQKTMRIESMFKQGMEFYENKNYNDAISLWEKVLLVNPEHARAKEYINLAKKELVNIAAQKKQKEHELNIKKAADLINKGVKYYNDSDWENAMEMFEEAKKLNPEKKETKDYLSKTKVKLSRQYYDKGLKLYEKKDLKEAIAILEKATKINSGDKEIKDALTKTQEELAEINKTKANELGQKGLKEYGLGNLKEAVELWEKALSFDPENAKIKNNLNRAKEELKKKRTK
ncbi:MAG: PorV/PorQ family protein [Endomicrobiales bacterium]|nr:PorV/PorQ family protein [Endomicrobiales bacterium]